MTTNGLRKIGSGDVNAAGGKKPGTAVGVAGFLATKNPAGLIISGGMHVYGEESGSSKVEGRAKQTTRKSPMHSSSIPGTVLDQLRVGKGLREVLSQLRTRSEMKQKLEETMRLMVNQRAALMPWRPGRTGPLNSRPEGNEFSTGANGASGGRFNSPFATRPGSLYLETNNEREKTNMNTQINLKKTVLRLCLCLPPAFWPGAPRPRSPTSSNS